MRPGEAGGIITGWLIKVVLLLLVFAFLVYEVVAVVVTAVNLDGSAQEIAQITAEAYARNEQLDEAELAAEQAAQERGAELVGGVELDGDNLRVTVTKQAPTIIAHDIGFLKDVTRPTASARDRWR